MEIFSIIKRLKNIRERKLKQVVMFHHFKKISSFIALKFTAKAPKNKYHNWHYKLLSSSMSVYLCVRAICESWKKKIHNPKKFINQAPFFCCCFNFLFLTKICVIRFIKKRGKNIYWGYRKLHACLMGNVFFLFLSVQLFL